MVAGVEHFSSNEKWMQWKEGGGVGWGGVGGWGKREKSSQSENKKKIQHEKSPRCFP